MTGNIYDLLDDKLEIEEPQEDDLYEVEWEEDKPPSSHKARRRSGLSPFQWCLLSFLFFLGMCLLTVMVLLVSERIMLPV